MDIMTIKDILMVGVPEVSLAVIFGLLIFNGKEIFKQSKITFTLKLVISVALILVAIRINRSYLNVVTYIVIFNAIAYVFAFLFVWRLNIRQAVASGFLTMFLIVTLEILNTPYANYVFNKIGEGKSYFELKFEVTILVRIAQILAIFIITKFKLNLYTGLLTKKWNQLTIGEKITITILLSLISMSIVFLTNYLELFGKFKINNIDESIFGINIHMLYLQTNIYSILAVLLISRTKRYEEFKEILYRDPEDLFNMVLQSSNDTQIQYYQELINVYYEKKGKMEEVTTNEQK